MRKLKYRVSVTSFGAVRYDVLVSERYVMITPYNTIGAYINPFDEVN